MRSSDALVRTPAELPSPTLAPEPSPVASSAAAVPRRGPRLSVVVIAAGDDGLSPDEASTALLECGRLDAQAVLVVDGSRRLPAPGRGPTVRHVVAPTGESLAQYRRLGAQHADGDILVVVDRTSPLSPARLEHLTVRAARVD